MKKYLIILGLLISLSGFAQDLQYTNLRLLLNRVNELTDKVMTPSYIIHEISGIIYATPAFGTGHTAYSGTVFSTVINSALSQISTGGTIYIKPGTYTVTVPVLISNYSNITLKGEGKEKTIFTSAGVGTDYAILQFANICNNIEISGIKFISTATNANEQDNDGLIWGGVTLELDNISIHDCSFTAPNVSLDAIHLSASESDHYVYNISFYNNHFYSIGQGGIALLAHDDTWTTYRWKNVRIENNRFEDTGMQDIWGMAITMSGMVKGLTIHENYIYNWRTSQAIEIRGAYMADVSNNKLYNDTYQCVGISTQMAGTTLNYYVSIVDNVIDVAYQSNADAYEAIYTQDVNYLNISNNVLRAAGVVMGNCLYTSMIGNVINNQDYYPILLQSGTQYSVISGNFIDCTHQDGHTTAYVTICNGSTVAYNEIVDNKVLYTPYQAGVTAGVQLFKNNDSAHDNIFEIKNRISRNTTPDDGIGEESVFPPGNNSIIVISSDANRWMRLPITCDALIGKTIEGMVGANGFELRTAASEAATVYINGVTTNVEAAIPANSSFEIRCIDATHWILKAWTALGAEITAIVPDAV